MARDRNDVSVGSKIGGFPEGTSVTRHSWLFKLSVPFSGKRLLRAAGKAELKLNFLVWYPCLIYWLWITYLASLNVSLVGRSGEMQAWGFIALQSLLIFAFILLVDGLLAARRSPLLRSGWVLLIHLGMASLYLDAVLYRQAQIHLPRALSFLFEGGAGHIGTNWAATGIGARALRIYVLSIAATILILPGYLWLMLRLTKKSTVRIKAWMLLCAAGLAWFGCGALKRADARRGWDSRFHDLIAAMPLYAGWNPGPAGIRLGGMRLRPMHNEPLPQVGPHSGLPDVFIFFLESTRADCINEETAPHLAEFSKECLPIRQAFSASNASHTSWYSILSGNHALYFGSEARAQSQPGSRALRLLRQLGYRVLTFTSQTLEYYGTSEIAFGSDLRLCHKMFDAEKEQVGGSAERDLALNGAVMDALRGPPGGRLFLIFYSSTHHDYQWPESRPPKFVPYATGWDYSDFGIGLERLRLIKNRYLNAVHFEDSLFGEILSGLRQRGTFRSSVVFAIGDHGEEFLEHGKLLHASNLYLPQTEIPFLIHFPETPRVREAEKRNIEMASHVDLMPTLLDFLGVEVTGLFDGESLLGHRSNEALIAAQNGHRDPAQFCIRSPAGAAFFHYRSDTEPVAFQSKVYLTGVTDAEDHPKEIEERAAGARRFLSAHFGEILRSEFPTAGF